VLISAACVLVTHLAGSTGSVAVFAVLYFIWGALLGGTTPVLLALISATVADDRQGSVLGVAHASQQGASASGIITGVGITQLFGLEAAFPLVATLYALSFLSALGIWLKLRTPLKKGSRA
jgi:MFS family permease